MKVPRSHSIRAAWIASYCLLIAVPVVISSAFFAGTVNLLKSQLDESNGTLVELLGKEIDSKLEYAQRLSDDVAWNQRLALLMNKSDLSGTERYELWCLSNDMTAYKSYDRISESVFVYFPGLDHVLLPQSFYPLEVFSKIRFGDMRADELRPLLLLSRQGDSVPVSWIDSGGRKADRALYLRTMPLGATSHPAATIGVVIDTSAMVESIRSIVRTVKADIVITNDSGEVLVSTLPSSARLSGLFVPDLPGLYETTLEGVRYGVFQRNTDRLGWRVWLLVPAAALRKRLSLTLALTCLSILLTLAVSAFLAAALIRRPWE